MTRPIPYESIPNGWFAVATSDEVPRAKVLERRYFGREWVLWRTEGGAIAMQDAYCPHLGAHLGDGCVKGESLRCPFHAFEFSTSGECVKTAYGKRPPARARLEGLPVREFDGLVFAWFHAEREAPTWAPPRFATPDRTAFRVHTFHLRGHPQEVSENSSDLGHFGPVHAYASAEMVGEAKVEGHLLKAEYKVIRSLDWIGLPGLRSELVFAAEVHGLGYSTVRARVDAVGVDVRLLVLPTPIDAETIDLRIAAMVKKLPIPGATKALHEIVFRTYVHDVGQDVPVWSRKRYVERPALADGDGPIAAYRRYASQFYSTSRVTLPVIESARDAHDPRVNRDDSRDAAE